MRGDVIYQVFGVHAGRVGDTYFGAFRSTDEAEAEILRLRSREEGNWARQYHDKGFAIRPKTVETEFEIPSLPKPRDKYAARCSPVKNSPGTWDSTRVEVFRRGLGDADDQPICEYVRNYAMLQTFEPFRQGKRELALVSRGYTRAAVLDLESGEVIAEESDSNGTGFCPVGFYVPDWWDVNRGAILPGSDRWSGDDEWPKGDFGFVWGCYWGDDSSWKVQHLDLSRVQEGVIGREERFGYIELATGNYQTPCLAKDPPNPSASPEFIRVSRYGGVAKVNLAVEMAFDLKSGTTEEWKRMKIANFE